MSRTVGQAGRHADGGTTRGHVAGDDRSGADPGKVANVDVAKDRCPRAQQHAATDPGCTAASCVLPPNGDVLIDSHLVADDDERTHDDAGCMIEEHRRSDRSRWMDTDLE